MEVLYFLALTVKILLDAVMVAMLIRVVLSLLFGPEGGGGFFAFIFFVTEIFITPMRFIFSKLHLFEGSPIDMAFTFTYLLLAFITALLPAL